MTNQRLANTISSFTLEDITTTGDPSPLWSIDFTQQSPATAGLSFSRASSAGSYDRNGNWVISLTDSPRLDHHPKSGMPLGLLSEESRTNYLLQSATPATQTVTLTAGTHVLWVEGAGSCTCTKGTAAGTDFGTAIQGAPLTFILTTAGTVVFTVTGSLSRFQCEKGATVTSFIITTTASATRSSDLCYHPAAPVNPQEGTFLVTTNTSALTGTNAALSIDDGNGSYPTRFHAYTRNNQRGLLVMINSVTVADLRQTGDLASGTLYKMGLTYGPSGTRCFGNGQQIGFSANSSAGMVCPAIRIGYKAFSGIGGQPNTHIQRIAYFNKALSLQTLQRMTA